MDSSTKAGKIAIILGTRPEGIKLASIIKALQRETRVQPYVILSGQHSDLLDSILQIFELTPDVNLGLWRPGLTPNSVIAGITDRLPEVLQRVSPKAVIVQGDTTTALGGALAAFNERIPIIHVEAGLRTTDPWSPFPEEMNRRLITRLAGLHLAATQKAVENLKNEGVSATDIILTGNTVIDALEEIRRRGKHRLPATGLIPSSGRIVVVTMHRRESWGRPIEQVASAIAQLAKARPEVNYVLPLHSNPGVRDPFTLVLSGLPNVHILSSLDYCSFICLLEDAYMVLTDSGGIQEEAPALGTPVLVLRDRSERLEAVEAGSALLIGCDASQIVPTVNRLLDDTCFYSKMAQVRSPFGDGKAAPRCAEAICHFLESRVGH